MNLRDLHYVLKLSELLHFGRAAEACHVSQPTLSMQIKKLEEELNLTLFERHGKQVLLTPAGERVASHARAMLREAEAIQAFARTSRNPLAGPFRLGIFPTLAPYLLPHIVPVLHKALPELTLLLTEEKTATLVAQVESGALDAALLALPAPDGLHATPLFKEPFLLALPSTHTLAQRKQVSMQDLTDAPLLLLDEGHCLRTQALEVCQLAGGRENNEFRATSLETLRHMVLANAGITLIPSLAARQKDGLRYIPFKEKSLHRHIGLIRRHGSVRAEACSRVAALVTQSVKIHFL